MINSLVIKNGELLPSFDKYNLNYSVNVQDDVNQLEMDIVLEDPSSTLDVIGNNNLINDENLITISITKDNQTTVYNLTVYKEKTQNTSFNETVAKSLELKEDKPIANYVAPLIGSCCFIIILLLFAILFHRKKIK